MMSCNVDSVTDACVLSVCSLFKFHRNRTPSGKKNSLYAVICGELIPMTVFDGVGPIGEFTL